MGKVLHMHCFTLTLKYRLYQDYVDSEVKNRQVHFLYFNFMTL